MASSGLVSTTSQLTTLAQTSRRGLSEDDDDFSSERGETTEEKVCDGE